MAFVPPYKNTEDDVNRTDGWMDGYHGRLQLDHLWLSPPHYSVENLYQVVC